MAFALRMPQFHHRRDHVVQAARHLGADVVAAVGQPAHVALVGERADQVVRRGQVEARATGDRLHGEARRGADHLEHPQGARDALDQVARRGLTVLDHLAPPRLTAVHRTEPETSRGRCRATRFTMRNLRPPGPYRHPRPGRRLQP